MNYNELLSLLKNIESPKGIAHWKKLHPDNQDDSYGIGLSKLREIAKGINVDPDLSDRLYESNNHDLKVIASLIDDPGRYKKDTLLERINKKVYPSYISNVFCEHVVANVPGADDIIKEFVFSIDHVYRCYGYTALRTYANLNKNTENNYFELFLELIEENIHDEYDLVKDAMNMALISIGKRNPVLNSIAIKVAKNVWPFSIDYGDPDCEPINPIDQLSINGVPRKTEPNNM